MIMGAISLALGVNVINQTAKSLKKKRKRMKL